MPFLNRKIIRICLVISSLSTAVIVFCKWPRPDVVKSASTPSLGAREVWLHPNLLKGLGTNDWAKIFDQPYEWPAVLDQIDVFQFFQLAMQEYPPATLAKMVKLFEAHHILIATESPGLLPYACGGTDSGGKASGEAALNEIAPLYEAGGKLSYIALDNSGVNLAVKDNWRKDNNCKYDVNTAFHELAIYMKTIHAVHPEIKFGLIPNLPNYSYNGTPQFFSGNSQSFQGNDYRDVLGATVAIARAEGENFTFVHVDNPYDYMSQGDVWEQRLLPLKKQTETLGLRFGLIMNTDLGGAADNSSDMKSKSEKFSRNVLLGLQDLAKSGAINESDFVIESWYHFPGSILNEGTANTFMHFAAKLIANYKQFLLSNNLTTRSMAKAVEHTSSTLKDSAGTEIDDLSTYQIQNPVSGLCVGVSGSSLAAPIQQQNCDSKSKAQLWSLKKIEKDKYQIISRLSGDNLDIDANTLPAEGAAVQQYSSTDQPNQQFVIRRRNTGFLISPVAAVKLCLDLPMNAFGKAGESLAVYNCSGHMNQLFRFFKTSI